MSESKPFDDASLNSQVLSKLGSCSCSRISREGNCLTTPANTDHSLGTPVYGPGGSRCIGGMNSIQALVWNVRTSFWMRREMTSGGHHEEEYRCQGEGRIIL